MNTTNLYTYILLISFFLISNTATSQSHSSKRKKADPVATYLKTNVTLWHTKLPKGMVSSFLSEDRAFEIETKVAEFYIHRDFTPAWLNKDYTLSYTAQDLLDRITATTDYGFLSSEFELLLAKYQHQIPNDDPSVVYNDLSKIDIIISNIMITCADLNLRGKYLPSDLPEHNWNLTPEYYDLISIIEEVAETLDLSLLFKKEFSKDHLYNLLERELKVLELINARGGWSSVRSSALGLSKGNNNKAFSSLKDRLMESQDLFFKDYSTNFFDDNIEKALKKFQLRNGIDTTGIVDRETLGLLNQDVSLQIKKIKVNMERAKWFAHKPSGNYLWINIPDRSMKVFKENHLKDQFEVNVGSTKEPTPAFIGKITDVDINPYWRIPYPVVRDYLLPKIQAIPDKAIYMSKKNYIISKDNTHQQTFNPNHLDFSQSSYMLLYYFWQKPGLTNIFGRFKFDLQDDQHIYIHEDHDNWALTEDEFIQHYNGSNLKIAKAKELAMIMMDDNSNWNQGKMESYLDKNRTKTVSLIEGFDVYILYFTAWVDGDGQLQFRDDIYGYDQFFEKQLNELAIRN